MAEPVLEPRILEGRHVRLEPLSLTHLDRFCEIGLHEELWRWALTRVDTREQMQAYIEAALQAHRDGSALPFAIVETASAMAVGSTRYGNVDLANRRVEIGWTWIAPAWQRTAVNTESKYLLMRHAFETLGCARVEWKTDARNQRSREAILRLGAKEEGVLRKHMLTGTGQLRDTVYYSVLAEEWLQVRAGLEQRLDRRITPTPE